LERGGEGVGRDAAGEGGVVVDEELEEMVEFVGERLDGAGLGLRHGKGKGQREKGLVAGCEGDVLQVAEVVCDLSVCRRSAAKSVEDSRR
jgi:hypothetical protein